MLSILIVEDSVDRIDVLSQLYARHKLTVCRDGQSAMQALRDVSFDLIHLDFDLGAGLDGVDVAMQIRVACPETLVIIHSEHPSGANEIAEILPGALQAPISILSARNRISSQLKALLSDSGLKSTERIASLLRESQQDHV